MHGVSNSNKHSGTAAMSQAEIAAIYGVTLQSIQAVEYRALRKIRAAIEREAESAGVSVDEWIGDCVIESGFTDQMRRTRKRGKALTR